MKCSLVYLNRYEYLFLKNILMAQIDSQYVRFKKNEKYSDLRDTTKGDTKLNALT